MAGWGGPDATFNAPGGGKRKPGYGRLLTFAIGGTTPLTVKPFGHTEPPTPAIATKASVKTIHEGGLLFNAQCAGCHGINAVAGPLPDLRYATKQVHDQFADIVVGGGRQTFGMPSFLDILTPEQVDAIEAYVLSRAAESSKKK
jgi:mono/diheme cytochrome c family protein